MDASAALIRYDAARMALAECARIDDAADIRDKAAALATYARQRDDKDMECWVREIHLRACVRIGELVRELDTAQGERTDQTSSIQVDDVTKEQAIAAAGISKGAAYNYQALAGGRDERAQAAGHAASEHYFAQSRAKSEPPTMAGLRSAVREAVVATLGETGTLHAAMIGSPSRWAAAPCRLRTAFTPGGTIMRHILPVLLALGLTACANARPDPVVSPQLDSGITSSNGGGTRALGNQPNVGVTTGVAR